MFKIPRNSKILSISHNDMDGVGCQILLAHIYKDIRMINVPYGPKCDEVFHTETLDEYDYIFVTDILPDDKSLLDRDNIIVIDHHCNIDNNPKKHIYINKKYCATKLVHIFLSKMFGYELFAQFNELVDMINDYDCWIMKSKSSIHYNRLFGTYYCKNFRERFATGNMKLLPKEKVVLKDKSLKFKDLWDNLEVIEFDTINGCLFQADDMCNELSHKLLTKDNYDFVLFNTMKSYSVSIRSNIDFNFGEYLKENNMGGGHAQSAGMRADTKTEMYELLNKLESDLYKLCPEIRKGYDGII